MSNIKSELDYVNKLSHIAEASVDTDFTLITETDRLAIEAKETELSTFLSENTDFSNYTEEQKDELFDKAVSIWNELKDLVKSAKCEFVSNGIEIKTIDKKLHQNVEYTTETLFYGLRLKKTFLDELPKVDQDWTTHILNITFTNAIALYHVLSTITVKGLNKENYALANILYTLAEISKVYEHYNNNSVRLNTTIAQWNVGLTTKEANVLNMEITNQLLVEEKAKANDVTEKATAKSKKKEAAAKA